MNKLEIHHPNSRGTGMGLVISAVAEDVWDRFPISTIRMRFTAQGTGGFWPIEVTYMDNGSTSFEGVGIDIPPCVLRHMLGRTLRNGETTKFTAFRKDSRVICRLSLSLIDFSDCVRVDLEITRRGEVLFCGPIALTRGECESVFAFCEKVEGSAQFGY